MNWTIFFDTRPKYRDHVTFSLFARWLCLLGVVSTLGFACKPCPKKTDRPESKIAPSQDPGPLQLPADVIRGVCLAHNWQSGGARGYGTSSSQETLEHLSQIGVNSVSLTPFGWMSDLNASRINGEHNSELPNGAEGAERIRRVVAQAAALGIDITLKPHLWVRGGKWRGEILPTDDHGKTDWDGWWQNYRAFILYYAQLAERLDVQQLVVGVELVSALEASPSQFQRTVEAVRSVYNGKLSYAANWDSELPDAIWDDLDFVGVQFYPPLTDKPDPSTQEIRAALRPYLAHWTAASDRVDRPLMILETGYRASSSAVDKPYDWPERIADDQVDENLQARAYTALFAELRRHKQLAGVYLWKYFTDSNTDEGGPAGFSPRGRAAEAVIRQAFKERGGATAF